MRRDHYNAYYGHRPKNNWGEGNIQGLFISWDRE
jgi:hypothetical protein